MRSTRQGRGLSRAGFTLVELIVVIAIITLLMALLAVFIAGVMERAQNANTKAIVDGLDKGCKVYRQDYNVFPPNDKGDSRNLHYYLGRQRMIPKGKTDSGPQIVVKGGPILEFPQDWLKLAKGQVPNPDQPVPIIDVWDGVIRYKLPGTYNKVGVDIWSPGKNGQDDLVNADGTTATDDIANWIKEY